MTRPIDDGQNQPAVPSNRDQDAPKSFSEAWWQVIDSWPKPLRYAALRTVSFVVFGTAAWSALSDHSRGAVIRTLHLPFGHTLPALPHHTGWVFLGYYDANSRKFDAEGPSFTFLRRRDTASIVPNKGDVIRLSATHSVMMYRRGDGSLAPMEYICSEEDTYDPYSYDTHIDLPKGTRLVIRDIQNDCRDYRQDGAWVALWVRIHTRVGKPW